MKIVNLEFKDYEKAIQFWKNIQGITLNESDTPEAINQFLNRNPGLSFVAKNSDGVIIGTVLCGHNGRAGQIYHLATAPDSRQKGLGKKLVEMCFTKLSEANIPRCNIFVYSENSVGTEFWLKTGWQDPLDWKVLQKLI